MSRSVVKKKEIIISQDRFCEGCSSQIRKRLRHSVSTCVYLFGVRYECLRSALGATSTKGIGMTLWCHDDIIAREIYCRCTEQSRPTLQTGYCRGSHSLIDPPWCFILHPSSGGSQYLIDDHRRPQLRNDIALSLIALLRKWNVIMLVTRMSLGALRIFSTWN